MKKRLIFAAIILLFLIGGMTMSLKKLGLQKIMLSLNSRIVNTYISNNADAKTRGLEVHVLDNGVPFDCTGIILKLYVRSHNNDLYESVSNTVGNNSGVFEVIYPEGMPSGQATGEIILSNAAETIGSFQFSINIINSLISDGSLTAAPGAGILFTVIQNEQERISAEKIRQDNYDELLNTGVLQTKINVKLKDLESTYAPRLTEVESQLVQVENKIDDVLSTRSDTKSDIELYTTTNRGNFNFRCINVIGDSISHGCHTDDMPEDSWAGIMRKFIQIEYNTSNYGFVNAMGDLGGLYPNRDMHYISGNSGFTLSDGYNTQEGNISLGSSCYISLAANSYIEYTTRKPSKYFNILYSVGSDMGAFDVYCNDVYLNTVQANSQTPVNNNIGYNFEGDEYSPFKIKIVAKENAKVRINGIYYFNDLNDVMFNNYARGGLRLGDIPSNNLFQLADSELIFFALGNNDPILDLATFQAKITDLISYCNKGGGYRTKIVVMDMMWCNKYPEWRAELKRLADNTNSIYIDYQGLFGDMTIEQIQAAGYLADIVHPTALGHQMIAEIAAKRLGLGISSKNLANKLIDQPLPKDITKEVSGNYGSTIKITKRNGVCEAYIFILTTEALPKSWTPLVTLPDCKAVKNTSSTTVTFSNVPLSIGVTTDGVIQVYARGDIPAGSIVEFTLTYLSDTY